MRTRNLFLGLVAAVGLASSGCYPYHGHHGRHHGGDYAPEAGFCALATCFGLTALGAPPEVAVGAAVVAGAVMLDHHDNHWHGHRCGCPYRWWNGYQIYYYGGRWEYYDNGQWYGVQGGGYDDRHYRGPGW